jgi:hypothetical protein
VKKNFFQTLLVFCLLSATYVFGQSQSEIAANILKEKSEVYLSLDSSQFNADLNLALSLDYFQNGLIYAYANKEAVNMLNSLGVNYKIERSPGDIDFDPNMKSWEEILAHKGEKSWDYYPTYSAYVNMMYQFQTDHPNLVKIYDIGNTVMNRKLLFAKVSSNVNQTKAVPRFMYTSTMHGDETTGFILLLRLIDYLATNYGTDSRITYLLDNIEIWICPNENPDGTYTNNDNTVSGATRSNKNGYDLNRNYPNPVSTQSVRQIEVQHMMNFTDTMNFVMSANMHGGIELVNYPYDSWTSGVRKHADHNWFVLASREYADTAQYFSPAGYMTAYGGITHGGDWYVVYGGRQDYFNYYKYCREITLELSSTKMLNTSLLPAHWDYNYRSFLNYMEQTLYGIAGTVRDALTLQPVAAKIEIVSHDNYNSEVYSRMPHGNFSRPILAGTYTVKVSATVYPDKIISGESVNNYQTTFLDVLLGENYSLTLIANPEGAGVLSGGGIYHSNDEVPVSATVNEGFVFKNWTISDVEISPEPEFTFTMLGQNVTMHANFYILGDVNIDGIINVQDLTMLISYILGNNPEGFHSNLADLNNDGAINVGDVVILINLINNK